MAKKKETKRAAFAIATDVAEVRSQMAKLKDEDVRLTTELKEAMHDEHLTEAGNYQLSTARTLKVADPVLAFKWAEGKNGVLKIDVAKAREALRHDFTDPTTYGFAVVESESVRPKGKPLVDNED